MIQIVNLTTWLSVLLLLYAGWTDFRTWKIPNTLVLALVTLYALRAVAVMLGSGDAGADRCFAPTGIGGDAGAGLLLFALGVVPLGFRPVRRRRRQALPADRPVHRLARHAAAFAIFLLDRRRPRRLLTLRLPVPLHLSRISPFSCASRKSARARKVPYGVIMVFAALLTPVPCPSAGTDASQVAGPPAPEWRKKRR